MAQRWVVAALRHRKFFNLADLNEAIAELLDRLNARPFPKRPAVSRTLLFQQLDRPALKPLPEPYVFAQWKPVRSNIFCGLRRSVALKIPHCTRNAFLLP